MSATSGAQSRGQLITIVVLAVALAASVVALVVSLVQLTQEKAAIQSAADNAQVVTKEVAQDSADLNQAILQNTTSVADIANQASGVAQSAGTQKTDAAAQTAANAALKTQSDKVGTEATNLGTAVQGIGTSIAAQQNASTALVTLLTDMQTDPTVGLTVLASNAQHLSDGINALCGGASSCTVTQEQLNTLIAEAASVSTGLTTQNEAFSKTDPTVSALAAAKAINKGLTDVQTAGVAASAAAKTLVADGKTLSTGIADAGTSAKKLSDNAAKLSDSATALSKSASSLKQSSSSLSEQGTKFNKSIQDLSSGAYTPDLAEMSVPTVVLAGLAVALVLLVALVIWLAVVAGRSRRQQA